MNESTDNKDIPADNNIVNSAVSVNNASDNSKDMNIENGTGPDKNVADNKKEVVAVENNVSLGSPVSDNDGSIFSDGSDSLASGLKN